MHQRDSFGLPPTRPSRSPSRGPSSGLALAAALAAGCWPPTTSAQRVDDNAVTAAEDAFGTSIGGESVGLYSASAVRGFSPLEAGNVRLEGLYFDRQAEFTGRLVAAHSIRVGQSALGYPLPAPTGIVDYRIRRPVAHRQASLVTQATDAGGALAELDLHLPLLGDTLGLTGGAGVYRNRYGDGTRAQVRSGALIGRWAFGADTEILPFFSRIDTRDREAPPLVLVGGAHLPPKIPRRRYYGQPWATYDRTATNHGLLLRSGWGAWAMQAGAFRSVEDTWGGISQLFVDTGADGRADRRVVADPPSRRASSSGEWRLSRTWSETGRAHRLLLAVRAREQDRRYGGAARVELGPGRIGEPDPVPMPAFAFGEQTHARVRQWTGGLAYEGVWPGVGELNLGLQQAGYRKTADTPAGALPTSRDTPLLHSAALALHLGPQWALSAGRARGLEEAPVAPEQALNRNEAPAPIVTSQADLGVRWRAEGGASVYAGVFRIDKPYYALDEAALFRRLGQIRHQGLELSMRGSPLDGLSLVAGAVLVDARVTGEEAVAGRIGRRPVGSARRNLIASLDWRLPHHPALSLDVGLEHRGRQVANAANTLEAPGRTLVDLGARYRFALGANPAVLRLSVGNAGNVYAWNASGSGAFTYSAPRQLNARLTVDFR